MKVTDEVFRVHMLDYLEYMTYKFKINPTKRIINLPGFVRNQRIG